jgi:catechol-2,3-dioxygenase
MPRAGQFDNFLIKVHVPRPSSAARGFAAGAMPSDIQGLHHTAYRCKDVEETRQFYEDFLGLPLVRQPAT